MNVSNLLNNLSISEIIEGITVKKEHYKELSSYNKIYAILYKKYKKLYSDIKNFDGKETYFTYLKKRNMLILFGGKKLYYQSKH